MVGSLNQHINLSTCTVVIPLDTPCREFRLYATTNSALSL
jgi:hypothetical protein